MRRRGLGRSGCTRTASGTTRRSPSCKPRRHVGGLLDINPATLRNWVERQEIDTGQRPGVTSEASAELKALRKENADLRRANEILKTASAFRSGGGRPPTRVIVAYIDAHKDRFGVAPICRVLTEHGMAIAPSTYYAARACPVTVSELTEAYAANTLLDCYRANRSVYRARKLWRALRRDGHDLGRDQVARVMGVVWITGVRRGAHTTITTRRDERAPRHPDLLDRAWDTPNRPDQWWVADI